MSTNALPKNLAVAALCLIAGFAIGCGTEDRAGWVAAIEDPEQAFAETLRIPDPLDRAEALARFLKRADPEDVLSLRAVLVESAEVAPDELSEALFASWWASFDPVSAFENRINPGWANRHPWLRAMLPKWLRQDPEAAVEAVGSLGDVATLGRTEGIRVLGDAWFTAGAGDPTPLLRLFELLEVKPRSHATEQLLERMVEARGLDETASWVEGLPHDWDVVGFQVRNEMMGRMGVVLAKVDLDRGLRWAEEHGQGREGHGVLIHFAFQYGLQDGPGAMKWAMALENVDNKKSIVKRAWISFNRLKPEDSREWMFSQEPVPDLNPMYTKLLTFLARLDPERALELAERATDLELRNRLLISVGRAWRRADPEAAQAWLASPELSEEVKTAIKRRRAGA